ncbi:MAG: CBS domain-containing protein [Gammaproteobacteria bacterium]|jgi:CBS domain-containing protein|nr:CBS domain-containing protein [Gammaproteobacteria bacterium]
MSTVQQLLAMKGRHVHSIGPQAVVYDAVAQMATHGVGALLVMDEEQILGVVSERDYARKIVLRGRSSHATEVREIMSSPVITGRPSLSIEEAMAIMSQRRIRHLPIVDEGRLCGLVSVGDLVKAIIADQQFVIAQLEQYIHR